MTDKPPGRTRTQRITRTEKPNGMVEVRLGSSSAKVYPVRNKNRVVYQVVAHIGGRRYRTSYTDKKKAITKAELAVKKLNAGEGQVLSLVNQDRQDYLAARRLLTPHQVGLVEAAKEYSAALRLLKGVPLLTAVQSYAKTQGTNLPAIQAEALVQKFIQTRTEDGSSARYIADLRSRLGRFGKAFQTNVSTITTQDLDKWLRGLNINPRNRRNFRTLLVALFNFAREQGYLPKHLTTAADIGAEPDPKGSGNTSENCADLAAGVLNAGGVKTGTPKSWLPGPGNFTHPDKQYNQFQKDHGSGPSGTKAAPPPPNQPPTKSSSTANPDGN